jgi:hypothetical protein
MSPNLRRSGHVEPPSPIVGGKVIWDKVTSIGPARPLAAQLHRYAAL